MFRSLGYLLSALVYVNSKYYLGKYSFKVTLTSNCVIKGVY